MHRGQARATPYCSIDYTDPGSSAILTATKKKQPAHARCNSGGRLVVILCSFLYAGARRDSGGVGEEESGDLEESAVTVDAYPPKALHSTQRAARSAHASRAYAPRAFVVV